MNWRERTLIVVTLSAGALAGAGWGFARVVTAADAAASAAQKLAECERLARRIDMARGDARPASVEAGPQEAKASELNRRIGAAARAADVPDGSIGLIEPGPARRLADGPYVEQATGVRLRGVGLRQLFTLLHTLAGPDARIGLKTVRLTALSGDATADAWNVEATLAHTTYAPKDSATVERKPAAAR